MRWAVTVGWDRASPGFFRQTATHDFSAVQGVEATIPALALRAAGGVGKSQTSLLAWVLLATATACFRLYFLCVDVRGGYSERRNTGSFVGWGFGTADMSQVREMNAIGLLVTWPSTTYGTTVLLLVKKRGD
jgi:hypothetical protein